MTTPPDQVLPARTAVAAPPVAGPPSAAAAPAPRLAWIDNLRIWLTALVVLHHAAFTYAPFPAWPYREPDHGPGGDLLLLFGVLNQMWFMSAFFFVSGLFVPGSYERKGARRFVVDRLWRLGLPLLLVVVALRPLVDGQRYQAARDAAAAGTELSPAAFYLETARPIWMWFVEVLLIMCVVYAAWRTARARRASAEPHAAGARSHGRAPGTPGPVTPEPGASSAVPGAWTVVALGAGLVVVTYLWRIVVPSGTYWPVAGLPTPDHLPLYVAFFVLGTLALRRGRLAALTPRAGWIGAGAAVAGALVQLAVIAAPEASGGGTWQSFVVAAGLVPTAIGTTVAALALFRSRFARQGALLRFLSAHTYAVYVVHGLVLVAIGRLLAPLDAPGPAKFVLLAVAALPVCWAVAWAVRSIPGAKRVF
ncbi:acyltransferase family protein [Myceligenerans pegani]|uniref:Acyltransferase n=1 Tax=Myceligenerans pegani TaxID=2776917 RepID=A0ABR9MY82_9MICO|nr:acyltransferase [Myceligenerans sp. TRM 65318]MBE1876085.1 acyltransferase [Myceligenerans sp. TRM 65318]MBE3018356.1 acyltransferase [Myceligenerans sp. TRM 65318]